MPSSSILTEIQVKTCSECGRELETGVTACPLHNGAAVTTTTLYRRYRKERVAFMIGGGIAISLITFIATAAVTGRADPLTLLAGVILVSAYYAGKMFFGLNLRYDFYAPGKVPDEAHQEFSWKFFAQEALVVLGIVLALFVIMAIVRLPELLR